MRTIVLKLFCWLCLAATTTNILAYQNTNTNSKTDYIETQWRHKLNTKDYSNRYASLLMGSGSSSSTTYKPPPWVRTENTKSPSSRSSYSYSYSNSNNNNNNNNNAVRLRHSRYPHLDGVMTRLDKMQPITKPPTTTSPPLIYNNHKHRYHFQNTKSSDKLFNEDSYDDDDLLDYEEEDEGLEEEEEQIDKDNEDLPDYDNWGNDEDDIDDNDDEDLLDNGDDGWQAEEATEAGPSSLTEYKWQHFGTRRRVEESRNKQNYPEHYAEVDEAVKHALRMNRETRCREPYPRVLSIQSEHPDPAKSYMPHCTVLHRCAEDTGCCPNHATKCAPKKQTIVHLYFYTTTIGKSGTRVEKLPFYNHTECACLDKSTTPTTLDAPESDTGSKVSRPYRSNLSVRAADESLYSSPETIRRCKCPEEYTPRLHRGTHCTCDCTDNNLDCSLIKRGNEFFSLKDRLCILNSECGVPSCEYGAYIRNVGRCPRKQEKIEAFANVPVHVN